MRASNYYMINNRSKSNINLRINDNKISKSRFSGTIKIFFVLRFIPPNMHCFFKI